MNKELKILLLEDSEEDVLLIQRELSKAGFTYSSIVVDTREEFQEALRSFRPDVILSDHSLPEFNSVEALNIYQKERRENELYAPFILVTGAVSEEFAVRCIKDGASDYILKDRLKRLPSAIISALEKQKTKQEKRRSEEELNNFFNLSPDMLCIWGTDGYIKKINPAVTAILGYHEEEIYQHPLLHFVHPDDKEITAQEFKKLQQHNHPVYLESRIIGRDGEIKWIAWSSSGIVKESVAYAIGKDITGKKNAEEALRALNEELLNAKLKKQQEITEAVIAAQEAERQEIGRELHDNICQILASSRLYLSMGKSRAEDKQMFVETADDLINTAINEIRNLSHSLIVPHLHEEDFCGVIKSLADDVRKTGSLAVNCQLHVIDEQKLSAKLKLNLYRIIQEQFHNIMKYAKASNVEIILLQEEQKVLLKIADDGIGFDTSKKAKGIGFVNMQTRVSMFGGEMKLTSSPGKGCTLEMCFSV